jgi:hypothetical protein
VSFRHPTLPVPHSEGWGFKQSSWRHSIPLLRNRLILFLPILAFFFGPMGCVSKTFLNPGTPLDQGAQIKGDSSFILYGTVIDTIDGQSLDYANSAYVSPGLHLLKVSYYLGGAPNHTEFIKFSAQAGRSYVVKVQIKDQWTASPTRYFFWVEDVKTGEVAGETSTIR